MTLLTIKLSEIKKRVVVKIIAYLPISTSMRVMHTPCTALVMMVLCASSIPIVLITYLMMRQFPIQAYVSLPYLFEIIVCCNYLKAQLDCLKSSQKRGCRSI